jgi:hypothetical protein
MHVVLMIFFMAIGVGIPSICLAVPTAAEYGVVLNLSGKQRMLSQKMSKEAMLIALDVDTEKNLDNLAKTAALFDKTLKGLRNGDADLRLPPTTSDRILRQLDKSAEAWTEYHKIIQEILAKKSVSPEQVKAIAAQNLLVLKEMNNCVKLYENDASQSGLKADPELAVTINLSGKQRMLSQKMSKEFLLIAYGQDVEDNRLNLLETYTLFERTLKGLLDGDETLGLPGTKQEPIRQQLQTVQKLWQPFKTQMESGVDTKDAISREMIAKVAENNLPLLQEMNKAVEMYEQEAAK